MNQALYEIAKDDIKASELLLLGKMPIHSLYFLKQSVEKFWKAVAIDMKFINESKLKDEIGHSVIKIFKKVLQFENVNNNKVSKSSLPNYDDIIQVALKDFEKFESRKYVLTTDEQNSLIELITRSEDIPNVAIDILNEIDDSEKIMTFLIEEGLIDENPDLSGNEKFKKIILQRFKNLQIMLPNYINSLSCLLFAAILLSSVKDDIRYPLSENGFPPAFKYNAENNIILFIPQLIIKIKSLYERIDEYHNFKAT